MTIECRYQSSLTHTLFLLHNNIYFPNAILLYTSIYLIFIIYLYLGISFYVCGSGFDARLDHFGKQLLSKLVPGPTAIS